MAWRQYVLQDPPSRPVTLENLRAAISDFLKANDNLRFKYAYTENLEPDLKRSIWLGEGGHALLKLVDDTKIPARYLIVEAETPQEIERLAVRLGQILPVVSISELQQQAKQNKVVDPGAVTRLAIATAGQFDQKTLDIVQAALGNPGVKIRYAGVMAAGLLQWPEFCPELKRISQYDPDLPIREVAARALTSCERMIRNENGLKDETS